MRFRLYPTKSQEAALAEHCAQARFVWNLALEQRNMYRRALGPTPSYVMQSHQLTEARSATWLGEGSRTIQEQALRDLDRAFHNWWKNPTHFHHPTWRKRGTHEGLRFADSRGIQVQRLSRKRARVKVPIAGWVDWRWTSDPGTPKSYRVKLDRAGRWWISFPSIPDPIPAPGTGAIVGVDRGVVHAFVMNDGEMVDMPRLSPTEADRLLRLQRTLARQTKGSNRRTASKRCLGRLKAREINRRKDTIEKLTTRLATDYDLIRIEDLKIARMTRSGKGTRQSPGISVAAKAGLNREILKSGWGMFATRLENKAPGRVEKINPVNTSRRCSGCGHIATESRESQSRFVCVACGYTDNADVNAAKNIAAGHAVTARGGIGVLAEPVKREPQLVPFSA